MLKPPFLELGSRLQARGCGLYAALTPLMLYSSCLQAQRIQVLVQYVLLVPQWLLSSYYNGTWTLWVCCIPAACKPLNLREPGDPKACTKPARLAFRV